MEIQFRKILRSRICCLELTKLNLFLTLKIKGNILSEQKFNYSKVDNTITTKYILMSIYKNYSSLYSRELYTNCCLHIFDFKVLIYKDSRTLKLYAFRPVSKHSVASILTTGRNTYLIIPLIIEKRLSKIFLIFTASFH